MWQKGQKQKVRKFWGLIPAFVEVTGEKLVEGAFLHPPSWIRISQTLNITSLYLSTFLVKVNEKFFKIKKKPYCWVIFAQNKFFLNTLDKYNYWSGSQNLYHRYRVDWQSNQILLHHYLYIKTIQSICSIHQNIWCEIQLT